MPRETVQVDPHELSGQRKLMAWCIYPNAPDKRAAYLSALGFKDCITAEKMGDAVAEWPWGLVKALGRQNKSATDIVDEAGKIFRERVTAAACMAERLLDGRATKVREGAAVDIAAEMREYYGRQNIRGSAIKESDVLNRIWSPYKPVVHLALALTLVQREAVVAALPDKLRKLSEEEVSDLMWKYKEGDPEAQRLLNREPGLEDFALAIERAETIRTVLVKHPRIRIKEHDTIKFIATRS